MNKINNEEHTYKNPILPGFYPDPSICRAHEDYYMVTSSFAYFPGVPIFHSKDLVNWEQLGHVLDRPSQLDLDDANISGGIFAPTIRYHKGIFYVITTNITNGGNFIVTAENPAGPWSEPYWLKDAPGIDPSLFFDEDSDVDGDGDVGVGADVDHDGDDVDCDGNGTENFIDDNKNDFCRAYYTGTRTPEDAEYLGNHEIWCQELDLKTMKLVGERHGIWRGALKNAFFPEGPHLYKINGYYYLMIAEGGTDYHHSVTIARSRSIFGPYESNPGNPILTHRHLGKRYPVSNPGHADLVETQNGEWWMVALASRPYGGYYRNLGRETFLMPVEWEDWWPIISPGTGRVESKYQVPNLQAFPMDKAEARENFDKETLSFIWNGIRTPREEFYSLTERPGFLRLKLRPQGLVDVLKMPSFSVEYKDKEKYNIDHPSFIGRRQQHMNFTVCVKMEFTPQMDCEVAGLALIQNNNFQYRFEYTLESGQKVIRLMKCISKTDMNFAKKIFHTENIETKLAERVFASEVIYLKISACGQDYNFYYGEAEKEMRLLIGNVDGKILSPDLAGGFVGTYIGMFASSNGKHTDNIADFDWFEYKGNI